MLVVVEVEHFTLNQAQVVQVEEEMVTTAQVATMDRRVLQIKAEAEVVPVGMALPKVVQAAQA